MLATDYTDLLHGFTCLFLCLFVAGVSCHTKATRVAQEIERRGYHLKESAVVEPTAWQRSTFRIRSKQSFSFRAKQPLPAEPDTYCRFTLFEETYDSEADAQNRLTNIHLPDPTGPAEEQHYLSAMRTGFQIGKTAYVFQADAAIFWDEVQRLAKELAEQNHPRASVAEARVERGGVFNPKVAGFSPMMAAAKKFGT
jgi:hypothetical protein